MLKSSRQVGIPGVGKQALSQPPLLLAQEEAAVETFIGNEQNTFTITIPIIIMHALSHLLVARLLYFFATNIQLGNWNRTKRQLWTLMPYFYKSMEDNQRTTIEPLKDRKSGLSEQNRKRGILYIWTYPSRALPNSIVKQRFGILFIDTTFSFGFSQRCCIIIIS